MVHLLSSARDLARRSPYQKAIVPKAIELAAEMLAFGHPSLQNMTVDHIEKERQGLAASKDFLQETQMDTRWSRGVVVT